MWHWLRTLMLALESPAMRSLGHELEVKDEKLKDALTRLDACDRMWSEDQHTLARLNAENNDLVRQLREMGKEIES